MSAARDRALRIGLALTALAFAPATAAPAGAKELRKKGFSGTVFDLAWMSL